METVKGLEGRTHQEHLRLLDLFRVLGKTSSVSTTSPRWAPEGQALIPSLW